MTPPSTFYTTTKNNTQGHSLQAEPYSGIIKITGGIVVNLSGNNAGVRDIIGGKLGRKLVARLLWAAFPECHSQEQVAAKAAKVLDLDARHVRRLLDCEHSVNVDVALAVMALAGFEKIMVAYIAVAKKF
jgi:hypothetical protein